jgi:transketolase C-terminal domain/subunit
MNNKHQVTVRRYHDSILAQLVTAALHEAGIETIVLNPSTVLPTDEYLITVSEQDVEAAIDIIESKENI